MAYGVSNGHVMTPRDPKG